MTEPVRPSPPPAPFAAASNPVGQGSLAATLRKLASLSPVARPSDLWRGAAFALLRVAPRECEALALLFEEEHASDDLRTLVLDLLAGAGTFEAQVVIRRLLALSVARRDSRTFATFVQRLAIVECPDGPTLRFLMSVYAESRSELHDVRAACAYALGAAAGQAIGSGDPEAAVRASDVLRRDLHSAESVPEKCALLTALGNAGVVDDVALITRFTVDHEAAVRAAAALALRKMAVPDARVQLVVLLADDEMVARSALAALTEHHLVEDDLERVADLVLGGRTSLAIDGRLLRMLVAQRAQLTASAGRAGAIEQALRLLLGRVEAASSSEIVGSGERRVVAPRANDSLPPPPLSPSPRRPSPAAIVSGSYLLVKPEASAELGRDRMIQLGLDPDAKLAQMPAPPPRRASGEVAISLRETPRQPLRPTRMGPYGPGDRDRESR